MEWSAVVAVWFSAVAANHLGLVEAVEGVARHSIPIVNCPKCLSFWSVLLYGLLSGGNPIYAVATALLCSGLAIWLELLMGFTDTLYNRLYGKIYPTADSAADDAAGAQDAMPELRIDFGDSSGSEGAGHPEPAEGGEEEQQ